ncbi:hypothetical protein GCM10010124_40940 [Pilimelia terevasa]|uniref:Rieske domain-containing protein n=1 Tax=Pilimelia terevasa TaxID=53372 RepID=A0A8J3BUG0_9ACTN|nr:Rieske (2Fe-2S) protein [Pilimelia terevasa]GGK43909.1 hypothetical protein GCM10010124_40940 [Pilimelia terevasa]
MSPAPQSPSPTPGARPRADAICPVRRGILAAAGGVSVAALLSACGDDYSGYSVPPVNNAGASASADTGGGGSGGDGGGSGGNNGGGGGDAPAGDALAKVDDIPVGGGKVIDGLLVMQPKEGRFRAFDAACPHQGVQVSPPEDGTISCSGHGAQFDEQGAVTKGPAQSGLTRRKLRVRNGEIFRA